MPVEVVCAQCDRGFTAQRSTRRYCSESCRQKAKRDRERSDAQCAQDPGLLKLLPQAMCRWHGCTRPLFPLLSVKENNRRALTAMTHSRMSHIRKYCCSEHRNAARSVRNRVARMRAEAPYRVTTAGSNTPPWGSALWLEMATIVLEDMLASDWKLGIPPDPLSPSGPQEWTEVAGLRWIREIAERRLGNPAPVRPALEDEFPLLP